MPAQRILVLFNEPVLPSGHQDAESEHEILFVTDVIAKILVEAGFDVGRLGISHSAGPLLHELENGRPDAVFNLFEGLPDQGHTEAAVASLLEWQGIPFTGSPAEALHLARNKPLAKYLLQGAGLPTPEFQVVEHLPLDSQPRRWPVIVKPGLQDASVGIDQGSVVECLEKLAERVEYLLRNYGPPVLVERYIPGREFNVSVIDSDAGPRALPLCEIQFDRGDPSTWPIVTYDAKWRPESFDFLATPPHFVKDLDPRLADDLRELATRAYRLIGCRDYARVDCRVTDAGKPYVIEVNPNPCLNPTAGLSSAVGASGASHAQFIVGLTRAALARGQAGDRIAAVRGASERTKAGNAQRHGSIL